MGLDNGFQLKHKKKDDNNASSVGRSIEIPFEIAYFRKYFELDKWCMHHCKHIRDDEVQITKDDLNKLWNTIEPIVKVLRAQLSETIKSSTTMKTGIRKSTRCNFAGTTLTRRIHKAMRLV